MRTTWCVWAILVTACDGGKGDDDGPVDTDPPAEDTWDSAMGVDTDPEETEVQVPDTGTTVAFSVEGRADIVGAPVPEALLGVEGFTFRYVREDATRGPSRCARLWDVKDWIHDEDRFGQANPISDVNLAKCDECVFTFTMSTTDYRTADRVPWEEDTDAADTDVADTDAGDTDAADTDAAEAKEYALNCANIEEAGVFDQLALLENDWVGYGYAPDYPSDDGDFATGTLFTWDSFNGVWVDLTPASVVDNELRWAYTIGIYSYPLY